MTHRELTCFKAYDVRGQIGHDLDADVAYRVGRAVAQHFSARSVVVGFDARETSPEYASEVSRGLRDGGSDALWLGMSGTEEMYWAVTEFGACAGIEVTASHNPIDYNGMKIVKAGSRPLDDEADFQVVRSIAEAGKWADVPQTGQLRDVSLDARKHYVNRVMSFVDVSELRPLKIVVNSGNGAAGPTFDAIAAQFAALGAPIEFLRVHHQPDASFPNGIPNPLLPTNHASTADVVRASSADFGVAFDGDFDRCFFFDGGGQFVPGEYVVGLLASIFLEKETGAKIVHDPRVVWNTQDIVSQKGGLAVQSKTGHAFIKKVMRSEDAVYGGEMSAHHYFRDFAYCDSGMIPWVMIAELVSRSGKSLAELVRDRFRAFPSSGEINFRVEDAEDAIGRVLTTKRADAHSIDVTDGVSLSFDTWRMNLRRSNTEPLVRLNVEARGAAEDLSAKIKELSEMLGGVRV